MNRQACLMRVLADREDHAEADSHHTVTITGHDAVIDIPLAEGTERARLDMLVHLAWEIDGLAVFRGSDPDNSGAHTASCRTPYGTVLIRTPAAASKEGAAG
jgi:hypothetical protein